MSVLARGYLVHVEDHQIYKRKDHLLENQNLQIQSQVLVAGHLVHIGQPVLLSYHLENHLLFVKTLLVHVEVHAEAEAHVEDHPYKDLLPFVDHQGDLALPKEDPSHEGHPVLRDSPVVHTEDQLSKDLLVPRKDLSLQEKHGEDQDLMRIQRVQVALQVLVKRHIALPESSDKGHHLTEKDLLVPKSHTIQEP